MISHQKGDTMTQEYNRHQNTQKRNVNRKKKRKKRMRFLLVLEILFIIILIPTAFFIYQFTRIPTYKMKPDSITVNAIASDDIEGYRNIAIFGVDSRANDLEKNTRSDSIMVASIHKKTKDVKLVSIYRDTFVNIDGHGYTKINHAYSYGGPELAITTINKNFDLNITDFITVNFNALTNVIDALGGVTIDITEAEIDYVNKYIKDVAKINGTECIYLKQTGEQLLNGTQATAYCRVRYTKGGDFTRAKRQRTVLQQITKQAKSASIPTLARIINDMLPQVYTSLTATEILGLSTGVFSYSITGETGFPFDNTPKTIHKASVIVPTSLSSNVIKLHEFLFDTQDYIPSDVVARYSEEISLK